MDNPKPNAGLKVVALTGRLDVATSPEVEARILEAIAAGVRQLVLDVSGLEYVSSAGLRVVIVVGKKVRAEGGDMVFACAGPNIRQILDISGFTKMFRVVPTVADAFPTA